MFEHSARQPRSSVRLVSTLFSLADDDLSMGHLDDASGWLMFPIGIGAVAVIVLVSVFMAPNGTEAQQRRRPLEVLGAVSLLILVCALATVLSP